ncbi:hypothetical protein D3C87_206100 [compost metagenome]
MNKLFIIIYFMACAATAQSVTSGAYTVSIDHVTSQDSDYKGSYNIQKNGVIVASEKFSVMKLERTVSINIQEGDGYGNTATYFYESKKFDCMGEEKEAKKYKDIKDIILNGILFYAELRFKEE